MRRGAKPAKPKVEAKHPIARKSRKREGSRVGDLEKRLAEALEQQAATSEILRVISQSPTDVQPIFDAIVESATRLCDAEFGAVARFDHGQLHLVSVNRISPEEAEAWHQLFPRRPERGFVMGRAVLDTRATHVEDVLSDPDYDVRTQETILRLTGYRTFLGIPIVRDNVPLGVLGCGRRRVKPFTVVQIELLKTFADQAVIAIENVRLFTELQASNRELTTALDQQTAISEILRAISTSPTDLQPVLDAVVKSATRFCGAADAELYRLHGTDLTVAAHHGPISAPMGRAIHVVRGTVAGRAVLEQRAIHVADLQAEPEEFPVGHALAREFGFRTVVSVPLLREGKAVGTINLRRTEVNPFTDAHITLLRTFADQAVIAIENVRLFRELEEKNRALTHAHAQVTESLEQQTATSDILRVISRSPTDVQPVFDAIAKSVMRLCAGDFSNVVRYEDDLLHLAAYAHVAEEGVDAMKRLFPIRPSRELVMGRAVLDSAVAHIPDVMADSEYNHSFGEALRVRSIVGVPMLREGRAIGAISVWRAECRPFSDQQIMLLQTFADQAVIAIENARLFNELQARTGELSRSVDRLTALGEVGRAVSSTVDLETVLTTIVSRAVQLAGMDAGAIYEYDEPAEVFHLRATEGLPDEFLESAPVLRKGEGVTGRLAVTRAPVQVPDISAPGAYQSRARDVLLRLGLRAAFAVPLLHEGRVIGGLAVNRKVPGEFPPDIVELLQTFATQSALAIQNARLFREIEHKSRQLEAASHHKSEFLANMSHELRTPLNAVIGFSEVLLQRMFGDLNAKQDEYLKDIYASGQHLLSLINDILDLSKIEAGRMELAPAPLHLPSALENAVTLVRERAARHGITLEVDVDPQLGQLVGDERKVKQVLLNLLSNAVKFTPEGGRISLKASRTDGTVEIAVTDTGIGIAPEDQAAIFEEFRQVGGDERRKQEGTGLGLTLAKKFIELHGGRIWVESALGRGSTFTFTLPVS